MNLLPISLAFAPSFIAAAAIPDVAPRNETIAKRGGEVNYLADCTRWSVLNTWSDYPASYIVWYSNVDNSQDKQLPDSLSSEYRNWDAGGELAFGPCMRTSSANWSPHWRGLPYLGGIFTSLTLVSPFRHTSIPMLKVEASVITLDTPIGQPMGRHSTATRHVLILSIESCLL